MAKKKDPGVTAPLKRTGDNITTQAFQDAVEGLVRNGFNRDRAVQMVTERTDKERNPKGKPEDRDIYHGEYVRVNNPNYRM